MRLAACQSVYLYSSHSVCKAAQSPQYQQAQTKANKTEPHMPVAIRNAALVLLTCFTLGGSAYVQAGSGCDEGCKARGQLLEQRVTLRLSAAAFSKLLASNASGQQLAQIAGA